VNYIVMTYRNRIRSIRYSRKSNATIVCFTLEKKNSLSILYARRCRRCQILKQQIF